MRIAVDAMGTDDAPGPEVAGAVSALSELDPEIRILLVGDQAAVEGELSRHGNGLRDRLEVVHAPERITSADPPASSIRRKPRSSIVLGLKLQQEGRADAFVSAGSTGAVMASSLFLLRRLPGVDRPAIGTLLPTSGKPTVMLDAGANVNSKPEHLLQFARLGTIYAEDLLGRENPTVALLNIGEEPEKGDELAVASHELLRRSGLNFIGNMEGRDLIRGRCDVLVCDGFVGNVLLKFYESVAEFIIDLLERELAQTDTDLELEEVFRVLDYAEYGGAPLLGVNGVSIICHGQSPPKAIRNAIGVAARAVSSSMVTHIARELSDPESAPANGGATEAG